MVEAEARQAVVRALVVAGIATRADALEPRLLGERRILFDRNVGERRVRNQAAVVLHATAGDFDAIQRRLLLHEGRRGGSRRLSGQRPLLADRLLVAALLACACDFERLAPLRL